MGKRNRTSLLPNNLPQLQNLIKRDPLSYREDFLQQYRHFESQLTIFQLKPDEEEEEFVSDIKNSNAKHKNNKLNKTLQGFMYTILQTTNNNDSPENGVVAKRSLDVCILLFARNDAKTVNVIAEACFHSVTKIKVSAIQFFLGSNQENYDEYSDDEEINLPDIKRLKHINLINKRKKSKLRKLEKAMATIKKKDKKKHKAERFNFSAFHLLNDPQGFSERLFSSLQKSINTDRFEVKLMTMNLISRIVGVHKLILLSFYSYLIRYIQPHQRDVTMVLAILAQASHELVPPDVLEPVVKAIANNFVTEHCAGEVMAAGLNAIREICVRQPLAIDATLLQDLTEYRSDKDKSVMMAARSLIGLFREINPEMLNRKDRGKIASTKMNDIKPLKFGQLRVTEQIEGIELLEEYKKKNVQREDIENGWEVASNTSSDDDEDWINVSSDDDRDLVIRDYSDDEQNDVSDDVKIDEEKKNSTLATTELLTPADFAKLNELKTEREAEIMVNGGKRKRNMFQQEPSDIVNVNEITGPRKKAKQDYEERVESIKTGREGRDKYGGPKKGKKIEGSSTTNKEKARNKAFMMVIHKKNKMSKKKISLRDKQGDRLKTKDGNMRNDDYARHE
ncbi:5354_t:CDS:10 [Acaulospora colombiana]|uniref:5354_t:CDS:1 n=1 Tax=Acaulospora colombiana TaxID=27376 RepID=A0ACA9K466_9GLOM|nr:5354_t:CDS:10 [Acaulospora colombiana]